jgi:hypothetical protein
MVGEGQPKGAPQQDLSLPRNWAQLLDSAFRQTIKTLCIQVNTDGWHQDPPKKIAGNDDARGWAEK